MIQLYFDCYKSSTGSATIYIYIYIYIERERERERDGEIDYVLRITYLFVGRTFLYHFELHNLTNRNKLH